MVLCLLAARVEINFILKVSLYIIMDELVVGTYEGFLLGYSVYSENTVNCILYYKNKSCYFVVLR